MMNMTKENKAEIKRLRSEDQSAAGELATIKRNTRKADKDFARERKAIDKREAALLREIKADVKRVYTVRARLARRIAVLTGRNS